MELDTNIVPSQLFDPYYRKFEAYPGQNPRAQLSRFLRRVNYTFAATLAKAVVVSYPANVGLRAKDLYFIDPNNELVNGKKYINWSADVDATMQEATALAYWHEHRSATISTTTAAISGNETTSRFINSPLQGVTKNLGSIATPPFYIQPADLVSYTNEQAYIANQVGVQDGTCAVWFNTDPSKMARVFGNYLPYAGSSRSTNNLSVGLSSVGTLLGVSTGTITSPSTTLSLSTFLSPIYPCCALSGGLITAQWRTPTANSTTAFAGATIGDMQVAVIFYDLFGNSILTKTYLAGKLTSGASTNVMIAAYGAVKIPFGPDDFDNTVMPHSFSIQYTVVTTLTNVLTTPLTLDFTIDNNNPDALTDGLGVGAYISFFEGLAFNSSMVLAAEQIVVGVLDSSLVAQFSPSALPTSFELGETLTRMKCGADYYGLKWCYNRTNCDRYARLFNIVLNGLFKHKTSEIDPATAATLLGELERYGMNLPTPVAKSWFSKAKKWLNKNIIKPTGIDKVVKSLPQLIIRGGLGMATGQSPTAILGDAAQQSLDTITNTTVENLARKGGLTPEEVAQYQKLLKERNTRMIDDGKRYYANNMSGDLNIQPRAATKTKPLKDERHIYPELTSFETVDCLVVPMNKMSTFPCINTLSDHMTIDAKRPSDVYAIVKVSDLPFDLVSDLKQYTIMPNNVKLYNWKCLDGTFPLYLPEVDSAIMKVERPIEVVGKLSGNDFQPLPLSMELSVPRVAVEDTSCTFAIWARNNGVVGPFCFSGDVVEGRVLANEPHILPYKQAAATDMGLIFVGNCDRSYYPGCSIWPVIDLYSFRQDTQRAVVPRPRATIVSMASRQRLAGQNGRVLAATPHNSVVLPSQQTYVRKRRPRPRKDLQPRAAIIDDAYLKEFDEKVGEAGKPVFGSRLRKKIADHPVWVPDSYIKTKEAKFKTNYAHGVKKAESLTNAQLAMPFLVKYKGKTEGCYTFSGRSTARLLDAARWALPFGVEDIPTLIASLLFGPHFTYYDKVDKNVHNNLAALYLYTMFELECVDRHVFLKYMKNGVRGFIVRSSDNGYFGFYMHFRQDSYTLVPFGKPTFWKCHFIPTNGLVDNKYHPSGLDVSKYVTPETELAIVNASDDLTNYPQGQVAVFGLTDEQFKDFKKTILRLQE